MASTKRKPKSKRPSAGSGRSQRWKSSESDPTNRFWFDSSRRVRIALSVGLAILLLLLFVAIDFFQIYSGISRLNLTATNRDRQSTNYLFVGSDSRGAVRTITELEQFGSTETQGGTRSDILLLLHVPQDGPPTLLSIPRDLLVTIPGEGEVRLTLLYDESPQKLVDGICDSLGIGIDHLVAIDFKGLQRLVDSVGGITVDIDAATRSTATGLDLAAGSQKIDGATALQLVRTRTGEKIFFGGWVSIFNGAELRMRNSEIVLQALGQAMRANSTPWGLHSMARSAIGHISVSAELGIGDLLRLKQLVGELPFDQVTQLPSRHVDGETPIALLTPDSERVLQQVGVGAGQACATK